MSQAMIPRYRLISPIKTPCRCPHMSRPRLLICSPRFSAWLINKCPCNFAQLVLHFSHRLNGEEKHIPFWCTSEGSQAPHQVVLITASRPLRAMCQWPPSLGLTAAGLCSPDKCCCHQPHQAIPTTPVHHLNALLPPFPALSFSFASLPMYITLPFLLYISFYSYSHPLLFPPFLFPFISVLYSFPFVIRSWRPHAGDYGGRNQPRVSGCTSSLRCSLANNEDGHRQNPVSHCARHTWGHNEQYILLKGKKK